MNSNIIPYFSYIIKRKIGAGKRGPIIQNRTFDCINFSNPKQIKETCWYLANEQVRFYSNIDQTYNLVPWDIEEIGSINNEPDVYSSLKNATIIMKDNLIIKTIFKNKKSEIIETEIELNGNTLDEIYKSHQQYIYRKYRRYIQANLLSNKILLALKRGDINEQIAKQMCQTMTDEYIKNKTLLEIER